MGAVKNIPLKGSCPVPEKVWNIAPYLKLQCFNYKCWVSSIAVQLSLVFLLDACRGCPDTDYLCVSN